MEFIHCKITVMCRVQAAELIAIYNHNSFAHTIQRFWIVELDSATTKSMTDKLTLILKRAG